MPLTYQDLVKQAHTPTLGGNDSDVVSQVSRSSRRSSGRGGIKPSKFSKPPRGTSASSIVSSALTMDTSQMNEGLRDKISELKDIMAKQVITRKENSNLLAKKKSLESEIVNMLKLEVPEEESEEDQPLSRPSSHNTNVSVHYNDTHDDIHPDDSVSVASSAAQVISKAEVVVGQGQTMVFEKTVKYKKLTPTEIYDAVKHFFQPSDNQWDSFMGYVQSLESQREVVSEISRLKVSKSKK